MQEVDPADFLHRGSQQPRLRNGEPSQWQYAGLDPATQTGLWFGVDGTMTPAELGKHGTSVGTYPPTQVGKDGKVDGDSGHDATQD
ncbi:putative ATP-grasp-modified RiPP [Kitasatospora sp. NPDC093558]|uniref:putative ATP-grasp-modified RiPP n=1 Tax=Kitasatospora sp. NPDC093558 TaxID=3155201 RepID=UPI003431C930